MKSPKGFGKRYFSLAAILAFSVSSSLMAEVSSVKSSDENSFHKKISKEVDDDMIVISKKVETKESDATYAVEVYTQKDIKNSHAKDLFDFLNTRTSLDITSSYGNVFVPRIDMRGYGIGDGYENIVVTVDGRRLNNIDMQPQLLSSIPLDSIKRIEILKGNGSVEYGDGANAGVINIITNNFKGVSFRSYVGSHGLAHIDGNFGIKRGRFLLEGFVDHTSSDGDRVIATDGARDESSDTNKGIKLTYKDEKLKLFAGKIFTDMDINYANALTLSQFQDDPKTIPSPSWGTDYNKQHYKTSVLSLGAGYKIDKNFVVDIRADREKKNSTYTGVGSGYINKNDYIYDSFDAKINYQNSFVKTIFGAQGFYGKREGSNITHKDNFAYYLRGVVGNTQDHFSFGIRGEKVKYRFQNSSTYLTHDDTLRAYEIGVNHKLTNTSSLFANYNKSYQAPDIDRLFNYNFLTSQYEFNGFIKPMKVDNYNVGYNYIGYPSKLKLTLFYANVKDEIYYNVLPWPATSRNTNIDKTRKYGLEIEERYNIHFNLYAKINYAYISTKIKKNSSNTSIEGREIPGVSKHNVKLSIGYSPNYKTTVVLSHIYRSKAYAMSDFDGSFGKMQSYNSTNFSINYKIKKFNLFAKVNNVFDKKNALFADNGTSLGVYPTDYERTFMVGVGVRF